MCFFLIISHCLVLGLNPSPGPLIFLVLALVPVPVKIYGPVTQCLLSWLLTGYRPKGNIVPQIPLNP